MQVQLDGSTLFLLVSQKDWICQTWIWESADLKFQANPRLAFGYENEWCSAFVYNILEIPDPTNISSQKIFLRWRARWMFPSCPKSTGCPPRNYDFFPAGIFYTWQLFLNATLRILYIFSRLDLIPAIIAIYPNPRIYAIINGCRLIASAPNKPYTL